MVEYYKGRKVYRGPNMLEDALVDSLGLDRWRGSVPCHGRNKMCGPCRRKTLPREQNQEYDWRHQVNAHEKKFWWRADEDSWVFQGNAQSHNRVVFYNHLLSQRKLGER